MITDPEKAKGMVLDYFTNLFTDDASRTGQRMPRTRFHRVKDAEWEKDQWIIHDGRYQDSSFRHGPNQSTEIKQFQRWLLAKGLEPGRNYDI